MVADSQVKREFFEVFSQSGSVSSFIRRFLKHRLDVESFLIALQKAVEEFCWLFELALIFDGPGSESADVSPLACISPLSEGRERSTDFLFDVTRFPFSLLEKNQKVR